MTSINLGLDDELAAQLERRAARAGIAPEALATKAIEEYLAHDREPDDGLGEVAATVGVLIREEMEVQHRLGGHPEPVPECLPCRYRLPRNHR